MERVLDRTECFELLRRGGVGRVAVNVAGAPPLVRPVNFLFDEPSQSVVFRTGRGSKLTALLLSERAAFEVDDAGGAGGWSVIVTGRAEEVRESFDVARLDAAGLPDWAPGERPYWVRVRAETVSGRRIPPQ